MSGARRRMERVGDLLPEMASALGLEEQLRFSRAMASWERLVEELVPGAAGASELLAIQPTVLVVSASAPIVAQELRLRATEMLTAFERAPGGARLLELRVVVRPRGARPASRERRGPRVD